MCNLPVVATPVGDIPERLDGVNPSWLCRPEAELLATALADCVAQRARSNGRAVADGLRQDLIARRVLAVHEGLRR